MNEQSATNKATALSRILREDGVRPNWLGKTVDGKLYEYVSYPWAAGNDVFVMVREPNNPATIECMDALQVTPEHYQTLYAKSG